MRPVTLILTLAVGLPLAGATTGCERERTRVVPATKSVEKETTVIERDVDKDDDDDDVDIDLRPDTRTQPPAGEPAAKKADEPDIDVEADVDVNEDDNEVKLKGDVDTD